MAAINDELTGFVRDALGRGLSRAQIDDALRQAGWRPEQIGTALSAYAVVDFPVPVPRPRPSLSARDAFTVYLLQFSTLFTVAYNLGSLLFHFVNRGGCLDAAAGPLQQCHSRARSAGQYRRADRCVPGLHLGVVGFNRQAPPCAPTRLCATSPVRRWLTYLTLFGAACTLDRRT